MEPSAAPDKETDELAAKIKTAYASFSEKLDRLQKENRAQINGILKNIDARKIKNLKDKLASL